MAHKRDLDLDDSPAALEGETRGFDFATRMGITDDLTRLSAGIEQVGDPRADLAPAPAPA